MEVRVPVRSPIRFLLLAALLLALPSGCAADATEGPGGQPSDGPGGQPSDGPGGQPSDGEESIGRTSQAITADSIMARAREWVAQKVPYCAVANHKADPVCGGTCTRATAPWDAYRSDCSGFVSWCWQISWQPSSRTYMVDRAGADGWKTIPIDSLAAGDALVCNGHVMIFSKWVTSTSFEIYQESGCGKVANFRTSTFKRNADGTMLIGSDTRIYHPIRRNGLTAPLADAGPVDTGKPDVALDGASDAAKTDAATSDGASIDARTDDAAPTDGGIADPVEPPDDGEIAGDDAPAEELTGSCAVGRASAASGAFVGGLALLAVAARTRRARRVARDRER